MVEVISLPNITAPKESPIFANMFNPKMENCLLSKRLLDSSANEDTVVNEPQKPMATSSENFGSRFQVRVIIEKTPNAKLPNTLIDKTFRGSVQDRSG